MAQAVIHVCAAEQVSDPGCYEFTLPAQTGQIECFVVHWRGGWYAYRNSCPHTGVSLNWQPHQFFDYSQRLLQCSVHGALFEPDSGLCIHGPCLGGRLHSLPVMRQGDGIYVQAEVSAIPAGGDWTELE